MRIIATILSIYILVLTNMPCSDMHHLDNNSISYKIEKQDNNHSNEIDLCSPFCFCSCCQTVSITSFFSFSQLNLFSINILSFYIEQNYSFLAIKFWRPPKI